RIPQRIFDIAITESSAFSSKQFPSMTEKSKAQGLNKAFAKSFTLHSFVLVVGSLYLSEAMDEEPTKDLATRAFQKRVLDEFAAVRREQAALRSEVAVIRTEQVAMQNDIAEIRTQQAAMAKNIAALDQRV